MEKIDRVIGRRRKAQGSGHKEKGERIREKEQIAVCLVPCAEP
jgi:hypothetical protein